MAQLPKRRNSRQDSGKPLVGDSARSGSLRLGMGAKRLQPNEPLHMTTRAASLASSVAAAASGQSAAASNCSRRSSSGESTRSVGGDDLDSDRAAKMAKVSSNQGVSLSQQSTPPRLDSPQLSRTRSGGFTNNQDSINNAQSDEEVPEGAASDIPASQISENENQEDVDDSADDQNDINAEDSADDQNANGAEQDNFKFTHNLRALRGAGVQSEHRRNRPADFDPPEASQVNDRQSVEAEESGGGILKRMPGRRRAPHPDLSIEVDLRRQLELKVAYRAVVKALKPILIELADRTRDQLQESNESHQQFDEYEEVISELNDRLKQRMDLLRAELREEQARLERDYDAQKFILETRFKHFLRDRREDHLLRCQNECLNILDQAEKESDSDATDYEDGVVPKLYHINEDGSRTALSEGYDSRSRFFIETEKAWDDTVDRYEFQKYQKEFDEASFVRRPAGFAVYDGRQRDVSQAYFNIHKLADASQHVEEEAERASKKAKHDAATGLHALADATHMASPINQDVKPNVESLRTPKAQSAQAQSSPMTREKSARRRKPPVKPPPLPTSIAAPDSYLTGDQAAGDRQPAPMHYHSGPSLPPIQHEFGPPIPAKMSPGKEIIPPMHAWQQRGDLPEQRVEFLSNPAAQQPPLNPENFEARGPASENFSRQAPRKRPGPRAFFANNDNSNNPQGLPQNTWEPFTNTMGPPTYLPSYVKTAELTKSNSSPTESPITPMRSIPAAQTGSADWPGFSNNSTGGHGRVPGIDRQMSYGSQFPGSTPLGSNSQASHPSNRPPLNADPWRRPNSPDPRAGDHSPRNNPPSQQQSYYPPSQAFSGYSPPSSYYGSYRPFSQAPSSSDRPSFPTSTSTSLPPLLPHPHNQQYSPNRPSSTLTPPPLPSISAQHPDATANSSHRQSQQSHGQPQSQSLSQPLSQPQQPYSRPMSYSSQAQGPSTMPNPPHSIPSQPQTPMQQYPGQTGHQKILPATLDPTRRSAGSQNLSPSTRPIAGSLTPTELDGSGSGLGPPPGAPSHHSSPRTAAISPSNTSASSAAPSGPPHGQHYGYHPSFGAAGQPPRHQPQPTGPSGTGANTGRHLQPTPPQQHPPVKAEPPPSHHQSKPYPPAYSPYAPIAPAPAPALAPAPAPTHTSPQGPALATVPPHSAPSAAGSPSSTALTNPRTDQTTRGADMSSRPNPDNKSDTQKEKRGIREKEWKFHYSSM